MSTVLVTPCFHRKAALWATSSLLGFEPQTAFGSGLLIINLGLEKVGAGSPGVTVAVATLINISFMLIGWSGRGRAAELQRRFTVTAL